MSDENIRATPCAPLILDGAMGSELCKAGLKAGELVELWCVTKSDIVTKIHQDYISAGAKVINTNSFGAFATKLGEAQLEKVVQASIDCALAAVEKTLSRRTADKVFSKEFLSDKKAVKIFFDLGPTGKLLKPMGDLPFEESIALYKKTFDAVLRYAVKENTLLIDGFTLETFGDTYEAKSALIALSEAQATFGVKLPVFLSFAFDAEGRILTGADAATVTALGEAFSVDALGVNCSLGPDKLFSVVEEFVKYSSTPILVKPNAGLPHDEGGKAVYDMGAKDFAANMKKIASMGAAALGGCCGTTREHIKTLAAALEDFETKPLTQKDFTLVTSGSKAVTLSSANLKSFEGNTAFIGERINPTGKKLFKEALRKHDIEYLIKEALSQEDCGADILDVNVGLPEINEKEVMSAAVTQIQAVCPLPLQIDTSEDAVMESAVRLYNGVPLINSVNGKEEVMEKIFPIAKKYGGALVCLLLDEEGISKSVEGRISVAKKIIERAKSFGIERKRLVFDALTMAVSSEDGAAVTTLATVAALKAMGLKTILGVSNISFGLPLREEVTAAMLTLAIHAGLTAAIVNIKNPTVRQAIFTSFVMEGRDKNCLRYIEYSAPLEARKKAAAKKLATQNGAFSTNSSRGEKELLSGGTGNKISEDTTGSLSGEGFLSSKADSGAKGGESDNIAGAGASDKRIPISVSGNISSTGISGSTSANGAGASTYSNKDATSGEGGAISASDKAEKDLNTSGSPKVLKSNTALDGESISKSKVASPLEIAIKKGLIEDAKEKTTALLNSGTPAQSVIDTHIMSALNAVGEAFEKKTLYLPQLLMASDAAKAAFEIVRAQMKKNATSGPAKAKVVIATVKGDIHDIGKNIVKVLLENYNFEVIDLGKDVPPQKVLDACVDSGAKFVGLSALMTTTVKYMEETIALLRKAGDYKIVAGGAVMNAEYAAAINADHYAPDAMDTVRYFLKEAERGKQKVSAGK